jgi:hypothetical protein
MPFDVPVNNAADAFENINRLHFEIASLVSDNLPFPIPFKLTVSDAISMFDAHSMPM